MSWVKVKGGGQIAAKAEPIGHDEGIVGVGFIPFTIASFEIGGQAGIEQIQFERSAVQVRVLAEVLKKVKPVPAGGFGGNLDPVILALGQLLS